MCVCVCVCYNSTIYTAVLRKVHKSEVQRIPFVALMMCKK